MTYFRVVATVNIALLIYLLSLWFDDTGQPRFFGWTPPSPVVLEIAEPARVQTHKIAVHMQALERPVFSIDRRQPLPPKPPEPPPPPDPLDSLKVKAVYVGPELQGILAEVGAKLVRYKAGDLVGAWRLSSITEEAVVFSKDDVTRQLQIKRR
jgi:hypothetical protein